MKDMSCFNLVSKTISLGQITEKNLVIVLTFFFRIFMKLVLHSTTAESIDAHTSVLLISNEFSSYYIYIKNTITFLLY